MTRRFALGVAIVVGIALPLSSCALLDSIFGKAALNDTELCARYEAMRVFEEGECGLETEDTRVAQCEGAGCFHEMRSDGCDGPWDAFIECIFDDAALTCESGAPICAPEQEALENCRGRSVGTACDDSGGNNCPPPDFFCD